MVTATMMAAAITGASAAASTIAVAAGGAIAIAVAALAVTGTAAIALAIVVAYAVAISVDVSRAGSHCGRSIGDGCSSRLGHRVEVDGRHSGRSRHYPYI